MTSHLSTFDVAKQGDVDAIATLILQKLQSKKIVASYGFADGNLNFFIESEGYSASKIGRAIHKYITAHKFHIESIYSIQVYKARHGWDKSVYSIEFQKPENVIEFKKRRQNNSILSPVQVPVEITTNSDIVVLRGEFQQLKQSFESEVERLSNISSDLENALQDNTKDGQNLNATMLQIIDLLIQYSPPHSQPSSDDRNDGNGRDNTANNDPVIETQKIPESTQLRQYLETLDIKVLSCYEPSHSDMLMDNMAVKLGKNYPHLARLHQAIVQSIQHNQAFELNLANSSQLEIANSTQSGHNLYNLSFLSEYHYDRKKRKISGKVDRKPDIINFFTGIWFERFIYAEINELFVRNNIDYECLINPNLEFANGDKFELDFLFFVGGQVLWIECKSGRNNNLDYTKYESHKELMKLPKDRSLMVRLQASEKRTEELTQIRDLTIANPDNLIEKVKRGLNLELDA